MSRPVLDDRAKDVLKSLIQLHVSTGEPVGSENLSKSLYRSLSPATIRNIMADLERLGYLDHPHTSAGRVPTDEGYRVYVDGLTAYPSLPPRDAAAIESMIRTSDGSPNQVLENASHLLSRLSHNVGFVVVPEMSRTSFRHINLVWLTPPRVLMVMVSRTGLLTNKVIEVEERLSQDELQACANYLNAHFAGMNLADIRARLLELMGEEKALYDSLLKQALAVARQAFEESDEEANVYLDGTSTILDKPEFEDVHRMQALFHTFEEKSRLVRILNACIAGKGIRVVIGHENPEPNLHDLALVTAGCLVEGEVGWGLGVLGSTRMEYPRIVALVDHMARALEQALGELGA
jgi:heat-inducible transcriptional repressor